MIRAIYEWIVDNQTTPYLLVNATYDVDLPADIIDEDGQVALDIGDQCARDLNFGNDHIEFKGYFGGVVRLLQIPVSAVTAVYASESGEGMMFDDEEVDNKLVESSNDNSKPGKNTKKKKPSHLKLVD